MPMEESVWFIPFGAASRRPQSIYTTEDAPGAIMTGRAFSVSLQALRIAKQDRESWYKHLVHPHTDVLVLSSSTLGSKPLIERVHYYKTDISLDRPILAHDLLSDVIWVCDDYQEPEAFYLELQIVTIDRSDEFRHAALKGFETFANTAGSIFPVALPFIALGDSVLEGFSKVFDARAGRETYRLSEPVKLFPPGTPRAKTIRAGQYVILSEELDATQYELDDSGILTDAQGQEPVGKQGAPLSYAVVRIDLAKEVPIDFVVSQRVATLLTQLKNDREGQPVGALQTSFGFLSDTLKAYTSFTDLQRYHDLLKKGDQRTAGENEQMQQIERREELQPFLPKSASAPAALPAAAPAQPVS